MQVLHGDQEMRFYDDMLYKHKNNNDVAIESRMTVSAHDRILPLKMQIKWWNVSSEAPADWFEIETDSIWIKPHDFENWEMLAYKSEFTGGWRKCQSQENPKIEKKNAPNAGILNRFWGLLKIKLGKTD